MLSNELLQGQLYYLHMSGIIYRPLCFCDRESSEVQCISSATQIRFTYIYYTSAHFSLFALADVSLIASVHAISFSAPIFERCTRHVGLVSLNNSLNVGNAVRLWRKHPLHLCNVTVFTCVTRQHWSQLCHARKRLHLSALMRADKQQQLFIGNISLWKSHFLQNGRVGAVKSPCFTDSLWRSY